MNVLKIQTIDRIGITHDVVECFLRKDSDIIAMEVVPQTIFLRLAPLDWYQQTELIQSIQQVGGVIQVELMAYLPSEEKENQIRTILSTVSEGIISIDHHLRVQTINPAAANMLGVQADELLHKSLETIWGNAIEEVRETIQQGIVKSHQSITLNIPVYGTTKFICCYQPIITEPDGRPQSVVILLRDMNQIHQLIETIRKPGAFTFEEIIHQGNPLQSCIETAKRISKSQATVLLSGESGTGKELFAKAIHYESERADGPYVPVNCAAIPETLLESEFFGYEEGAFTGARKGGHPGLFEVAQGGTLFLDEIGEIPLHLQAKLLRVLEDRTIRRVGGTRSIPIDVRIVAATNRNLSQLVATGLFREDLFYRLHVIPIRIPPLRERKQDIPLLARYFVEKVCRQLSRPAAYLSQAALTYLQAHEWPGNVRELQNVIERAVYLHGGRDIHVEHVSLATSHPTREATKEASLQKQLEQVEQTILQDMVKRSPSIRQAAVKLGISHTALLNKLKKYGIRHGT